MHTIIVGGLLLSAMICSGAEQESEVTFKRLEEKFPSPDPNILSDIVKKIAMERAKLIANSPVQAAHSSHPIKQDLQEQHQLLLPSTFPIHPVCYSDKSTETEDLKTISYLPQVHCWAPKNNNGSLGVYLDNDEKKSSDFYNFGTIGGDILFDVNKAGKVLFCLNESNRFRFRLTQQLEKQERLYGMKWDSIAGGAISALALHPKDNKAAFILRKDGDSVLSVFNFDTKNDKGKLKAETEGRLLGKKVAYCGDNTWAVLTDIGALELYQQNGDKFTNVTDQMLSPSSIYELNAIAINSKFTVQNGFKPLWACLSGPTASLHIYAHFHKFRCLCKARNTPALFVIKPAPTLNLIAHMSYEDEQISITYRNASKPNVITKNDVYTVDFEALYLYRLAKQYLSLENAE